MQSEKRDQSEESDERDQSMERPRISNSSTGADRLEMNFDGNIYEHGQHRQLLIMKEIACPLD